MASYFPTGYNPYISPYPTPPQASPAPQPTSGSMIWVQGESGAKSYIVPPNSTVMLMDSETDRFFIKSVDASGMPSPLRVFEYSEVSGTPASNIAYVTKEEFDAFKEELKSSAPKRKVKADEQTV